jgi:hypothetical protein
MESKGDCSELVAIAGHTNPIHILEPYFLNIQINNIFPSTHTSLPFKTFYPGMCTYFSSLHAPYVLQPSHHSWFYHHENIWCRLQTMELVALWFSPGSHFFILARWNIFLRTLFLYAPNLWDKFSHLDRRRGKIIYLFFNLYGLSSTREDTNPWAAQ